MPAFDDVMNKRAAKSGVGVPMMEPKAAPSVEQAQALAAGAKPKDVQAAQRKVAAVQEMVAKAPEAAPQIVQTELAKAEAKPSMSRGDKIATALIAVLPTLIGSVAQGAEGGAIGANVSMGALNGMVADEKESQKSASAAAQLAQERSDKFAMADKEFQNRHATSDRELAFRAREGSLDRGMRGKELDARLLEIGAKRDETATKKAFENLPEEKKQAITGLAKKNVDREAIANSIDATLAGWDKLSDDQKLQQGRQLLKTLNSTEGKDAVGAEEAKRLSGQLEFATGNLMSDNPIQFGRDLKGFKDNADITVKGIRGSINANNASIDKAYGRQSQEQPSVKEVGGKQYQKVDGGWKLIK